MQIFHVGTDFSLREIPFHESDDVIVTDQDFVGFMANEYDIRQALYKVFNNIENAYGIGYKPILNDTDIVGFKKTLSCETTIVNVKGLTVTNDIYHRPQLADLFELKEIHGIKYLEGRFYSSYRGLVDHYVSKLYNPFVIQIFNDLNFHNLKESPDFDLNRELQLPTFQ